MRWGWVPSTIAAAIFTVSLTAQTPTLYGTPQTAYNAPYGSTLTLNLPNGGQAVSADTIYIIEAAIRGENTAFVTPSGWSGFCSLQVDSMDQEQLFYLVYPSGSTPPSSVTLTSGGSTWLGAIAVAYTGINTTTPFDAPASYCGTAGAAGNASLPVPNSNPSLQLRAGAIHEFGPSGDRRRESECAGKLEPIRLYSK